MKTESLEHSRKKYQEYIYGRYGWKVLRNQISRICINFDGISNFRNFARLQKAFNLCLAYRRHLIITYCFRCDKLCASPVGTLFKIELATATRRKTLLVIGQRTSTRTGIGPERSHWLLLIGPIISLIISYHATSRPVIGRPLRAWLTIGRPLRARPAIGRPLRALACDWTGWCGCGVGWPGCWWPSCCWSARCSYWTTMWTWGSQDLSTT